MAELLRAGRTMEELSWEFERSAQAMRSRTRPPGP